MREDFLHYVWNYKKFALTQIQTTSDEPIVIRAIGQHNHLAGPDFFNAQLEIGGQRWAGTIEMHLKSSDWYVHGHETDMAYDNVILHVVWEHDIDIYRKNGTAVATLQLKDYVNRDTLENYTKLFTTERRSWIPCEKELNQIPPLQYTAWLDRLYLERLEAKTQEIQHILDRVNNDWEATLFVMLSRNFGTKINAEAFQSLATKLTFPIVRKCAQEPFQLEALLFGLGGLLPENSTDSYVLQLEGAYEFLIHKFGLQSEGILPIQFYKLRPPNFPTIRLSQLARLYTTHPQLFRKSIATTTIEDFYTLFRIQASRYWDTHYSFSKTHKSRVKKLSKSFIDLLLINTIIPIKFAYGRFTGQEDQEALFALMRQLKPEKNTIISRFDTLGAQAEQALDTQALLQLKKSYCDQQQCLKCGIGNWLMGK